MTTYGYNDQYLLKDGQPWLPVMGEIHYSRCGEAYWEQELRKMAAGGVQIISTYVIWIHHEEIEGCYDFSGQRDLRGFVQACAKCKLPLLLRIGPWCHGEVRNGGFPDWLLKKPYPLRTNDAQYLSAVKTYYAKIFSQVEGLLHKDGGPIIGIQIENEYGHVGGLEGDDAQEHMRRLTALALETGFIVPYYTATGWGGAAIGDLLPVMGGYCDAPWDARTTKLPPNGNYIFSHERNDVNIGSDRHMFDGLTFDPSKYPFLTAELGGGLQVTAHRRPVPTPADIAAISLVKLGSGANLLGYYMYHGGTNPKGKLTTLQESKATGYANDLPELSYDFQAPIREYGQITPVYKHIKLLALFLESFGTSLCKMTATIAPDAPKTPTNLIDLRTSVRHDGAQGYVFVNNHQRQYTMADHLGTQLELDVGGEHIRFPRVDIHSGDFFFFAFHMPLRYGRLITGCASPLCRLNSGTDDEKWVFYAQHEPQLRLECAKDEAHIIMLTKEQALNAWKIRADKEYLVLCSDAVWQDEATLTIEGDLLEDIAITPSPSFSIPGYTKTEAADGWAIYHATSPVRARKQVHVQQTAPCQYDIHLDADAGTSALLELTYTGDSAYIQIDGEKVADDFYTGKAWQVGLQKFLGVRSMQLTISPFKEGQDVYLQTPLPAAELQARLIDARLLQVHRTTVSL